MTDLSKFPWEECVLPDFKGKQAHVQTLNQNGFEFCEIHYGADNLLVSQVYHQPERWRLCNAYDTDELEQILEMCRTVELFIDLHRGPVTA